MEQTLKTGTSRFHSEGYKGGLDKRWGQKKLRCHTSEQRVDYEERNLLYICEDGHNPVTFSDAFEFGFVCTTCNKELTQKDNSKTISFLKKKIKKLDSEIKIGLEGLNDSLTELKDQQLES